MSKKAQACLAFRANDRRETVMIGVKTVKSERIA